MTAAERNKSDGALRSQEAAPSHGGKTRDESATRLAGSTPAHTPLPWFRSDNGVFAYDGADEKVLVTATSSERSISTAFANAAFIVTAVNAHAELVAALEEAAKHFERCANQTQNRAINRCADAAVSKPRTYSTLAAKCRAALAKLES